MKPRIRILSAEMPDLARLENKFLKKFGSVRNFPYVCENNLEDEKT